MRGRLWVGTALAATALAGTGCAEKRYAELVLREGYLESPEGERTPLGETRDEGDRVHRPGWQRSTRVARDGYSMMVRLSLASQSAQPTRVLMIDQHGRAEPEAHIVASEAYFRMNDGPSEPLVVLPPEGEAYPPVAGERERGASYHRLGFLMPEPLSAYAMYMPGANLVEPTWRAIERDEGNTYTLHLPFLVAGERWVHHMEFEVRARTRLVGGAPAMP